MLCRPESRVYGIALRMGLVLLICRFMAGQDVKTNYMPGTDFSKYKTYKWLDIAGADQPDQILQQQIIQAIDGQLAFKGMTKTEDDKADIMLATKFPSRNRGNGTPMVWVEV